MQTPPTTQRKPWIVRVFWFYVNGFREMTIGKTLWTIILIKLFIMFAILKVFFFPNFLNQQGKDEASKANYVAEQLHERSK